MSVGFRAMDQDAKLLAVTCALAIVMLAWAVREIVPLVKRRRNRNNETAFTRGVAAELLPLLLQPVTEWVRQLGRNRSSIESLLGPDGSVTLLFCDIEGSTEINRRLGDDEWVRVIREHDLIVDRMVRRHGGKVVKTQGDGFMAAFHTTSGALAAAVSLGPELEDANTVNVPLPVRIGVHTGTVVAENGDLFGTEVAKAARIAASARGEEILVSEEVLQHIGESDDFSFRRKRSLRFKGLAGRHRLYAVTSS